MASVNDSNRTQDLLQRIRGGDRAAREELLELHRNYLRRVIDLRISPELRRRVDPSDVVQETQMISDRRLNDYLRREPMPFRLWLRKTAIEQLIAEHRRHVGAQKRSVMREVPISDVSSIAIAESLLRGGPSAQMAARERTEAIQSAMLELNENDQEVLLLRHAEGLSNAEAAEVLQIDPSAASKRFGRALMRMHAILANNDRTQSRSGDQHGR